MFWSPCVGPTLGVAVGLASQSGRIVESAAMMALFGIGAALPLLAAAYGYRRILVENKGRLLVIGRIGKPVMGAIVLLVGAVVLTGLDKAAEAYFLRKLPGFWLDWITRY
jgi:cytochrome c biogenesis protein CcdA